MNNEKWQWQLNHTYLFRTDEIGYNRFILDLDNYQIDSISRNIKRTVAKSIAHDSFEVTRCITGVVYEIKLSSGRVIRAQEGTCLLSVSDFIYFTSTTKSVEDTAKANMEVLIAAMELREQGLLIIPNPNDFSSMDLLIAEIRSAIKHAISNKKNTLRHVQEEIESLEKVLN